MTIVLTKDVRVGGAVLASGTTQTLAPDVEADLVARGAANPAFLSPGTTQAGDNHILEYALMGGVARQIGAFGTPFVLPAGDGSAVGLQFTNTLGVFTLSGAILTNAWNLLKGCWVYCPANFGGSAYPAGWYWAVFSSDTAGVMYTNRYVSGNPIRPDPTPFPANLSGYITSPTTEIIGPNWPYIGRSLGKNGSLKALARGMGNITGNKTYRLLMDTTGIASIGPVTTNPNWEMEISVRNQGSESLQACSRQTATTGIGAAGASVVAGEATAMDTTVDRTLSFAMTISSHSACAVLTHGDIMCTYGP